MDPICRASLRTTREAHRRDVPNAEVHIVDGRDFGFETAADEIAQIVRTFVKQNPQRIGKICSPPCSDFAWRIRKPPKPGLLVRVAQERRSGRGVSAS